MNHLAYFVHFLHTIIDDCLTIIFTNRLIGSLNFWYQDHSIIKPTDYPEGVSRTQREEEREDRQSCGGQQEEDNSRSFILHLSWELGAGSSTNRLRLTGELSVEDIDDDDDNDMMEQD